MRCLSTTASSDEISVPPMRQSNRVPGARGPCSRAALIDAAQAGQWLISASRHQTRAGGASSSAVSLALIGAAWSIRPSRAS